MALHSPLVGAYQGFTFYYIFYARQMFSKGGACFLKYGITKYLTLLKKANRATSNVENGASI